MGSVCPSPPLVLALWNGELQGGGTMGAHAPPPHLAPVPGWGWAFGETRGLLKGNSSLLRSWDTRVPERCVGMHTCVLGQAAGQIFAAPLLLWLKPCHRYGLPPPTLPLLSGRHPIPGKAGLDEVMAAAVLTSLSTSPLVLGPPTVPFGTEPCCEPWKEGPVVSSSYGSSNNSGDWGWDPPSDQSSPSTPSPPLPPEAGRSLLSCAEETEAAHFLFGDPIPRKRKNSVKVMFKCLWKNCGKVLSTSSGIQKHIRTMHLGRRAEPEQSDGEEDFYYTELDINMDSLTDGLSSLTPMSPTSSAPPVFPGRELPAPLQPEALPVSPLSPLAPTSLCHIHTDHAYQGCLAPVRPIGLGDKRLLIPHPSIIKSPAPAATSGPRPAMGSRKPRGEAKKCRKVYGMENRDMWCTACRWKKACQRFLD
uniref:C2H2-type domain-containing protein n=2 Tax=Ornithorhynchus anatinus TaxID=9258 RepID=F7EJR1_ORNAN